MTPTVSVILPTFERASLLASVVNDLLDQPLKAVEVLVMDDGSLDDTSERIAEISDPRVFYWNLGKLGVAATINEGFLRSSAPYIMLLHDHDQIAPELLVELADALDRNPTASFAFCGYAFYDSDLKSEQERWLFDYPELIDGHSFLDEVLMPKINSPVLALSMIRRSALNGELLDTTIGGCADVELWHRLAAAGDVAYVRRILISVRGRDLTSQFASPGATLELMANILKVKLRFMESVPNDIHTKLRRGWRRQVDRGAVYVAWKALQANDQATLKHTARFVTLHGSQLGSVMLRLIRLLPVPLALGMLHSVRSIARRTRKSTL